MPDRSIWEGAPEDLDYRIRVARRLEALAARWDLEAVDPDTRADVAARLAMAAEELCAVSRQVLRG